MAPQHERTPELRRFLVINFRIGSRESGYLVGPALVSTRDYKQFHLWDEPSAAVLGEDDYEVVKVYRLGLTYDQVMRQFAQDFSPTTTGPYRSAGWIASDGTFFSAAGWADLGQHPTVAA
jgi:hypothetical protein